MVRKMMFHSLLFLGFHGNPSRHGNGKSFINGGFNGNTWENDPKINGGFSARFDFF